MGSSQSSSTSTRSTTDDVLASNGEGSMVPPPPRDDKNLTSQHNRNSSKNEDNHSDNKLQSISLVNDERKKKKKKPPPSNLTGFHLVQYKCRKKKKAYDICHSYKHSAFVSGKLLRDNEAADDISCEELFDTYKECIYKGMHKDRKRRGLPQPKEESALGMFLDDETDDV